MDGFHLVDLGVVVGMQAVAAKCALADGDLVGRGRPYPWGPRTGVYINLAPLLAVFQRDDESAALVETIGCHPRDGDRWRGAQQRIPESGFLARRGPCCDARW